MTITHFLKIFVFLLSLLFISGCASQKTGDPRIADLNNGSCLDQETKTMWQKEKSPLMNSIEEARTYAKNIRLGGHDDWRLPTVFELYDLNYTVDLKVKTDCPMSLEGNFWTDEKDGEGMVGAWEIGDQCDPDRQYFKAKKGFVRLIRP